MANSRRLIWLIIGTLLSLLLFLLLTLKLAGVSGFEYFTMWDFLPTRTKGQTVCGDYLCSTYDKASMIMHWSIGVNLVAVVFSFAAAFKAKN